MYSESINFNKLMPFLLNSFRNYFLKIQTHQINGHNKRFQKVDFFQQPHQQS